MADKERAAKPVMIALSEETAKLIMLVQNQLQKELGFKPSRQDCILYAIRFWQKKQSPSS